jgi:hypothetical protein
MTDAYTTALLDEAVRRALGGRIANLTTRTPAPVLPVVPQQGLLTDPDSGDPFLLLDTSLLDDDLLG